MLRGFVFEPDVRLVCPAIEEEFGSAEARTVSTDGASHVSAYILWAKPPAICAGHGRVEAALDITPVGT